jgi:hypothetical protein
MLRDLRIRSKLIGIFALPVLGMLLLASARIVSTVNDGLAADHEKKAIAFTAAVSTLAHELEAERDLSVAATAGSDETAPRAVLDAQRDRVDKALTAWRAAGAAWGPDPSHRRLWESLTGADAYLSQLGEERQRLDTGTTRSPQALQGLHGRDRASARHG